MTADDDRPLGMAPDPGFHTTMLGRRRFLQVSGLAVAALGAAASARGQATAVPSPSVARSLLLRLAYRVRDVDATARFWSTLGASRTLVNATAVMSLGGIEVLLTAGASSSSSDGSVVNHIAFRVPEFITLAQAFAAAGIRTERNPQFPETLNAFTPEGD